MPKIAQFEEESPIIRSQPISSGAEGLEAIGRTFGEVSREAISQAKRIGNEQSNVMMLQTQSHLDSLKESAQADLIKNPGNADAIFKSTKEQYDAAVNQAIVGDADRAKLRYMADRNINALNLKSVEIQNKNNNMTAVMGLVGAFPDAIKSLQNSAGDEKLFNIKLDSLKNAISSALKSGALKPSIGLSMMKKLSQVTSNISAYQQNYAKGMTAQEHNRQVHIPFAADAAPHNLPTDENVNFHTNSLNNDTTIQGIKAAAANGMVSNPAAWTHISNDQQLNEVDLYVKGAASVQSQLQTGTPFYQLENDLKNLQGRVLSEYDQGRKGRLEAVIKVGEQGQFHELMRLDGAYQQFEADHNQRLDAIVKNPMINDSQKSSQIQVESNMFAHQGVNRARARGMREEYINVIPQKFIQTAQQSFGLDQDPNLLKTSLSFWDHNLREYTARNMVKPLQKETVRAVSNLLGSGVHDQDINNLIMANQDGRDFSSLKQDNMGESVPALRTQITSRLSNVTQYISQQKDGFTRANAMVQMTANLTQLLAMQSGDLSKPSHYIDQAVEIIKKAYPISQGAFWKKNDRDFPGLDNNSMDMISDYLINHTKDNVLAGGVSQARLSSMLDYNALHVMGTNTGKLLVLDQYDNVLYDTPYTSDLATVAAKDYQERYKKRVEEYSMYEKLRQGPSRLPKTRVQEINEEMKTNKPSEPSSEENEINEFREKAVKGFKEIDKNAAKIDEKFKQTGDQIDEDLEKIKRRGKRAAKKFKVKELLEGNE